MKEIAQKRIKGETAMSSEARDGTVANGKEEPPTIGEE